MLDIDESQKSAREALKVISQDSITKIDEALKNVICLPMIDPFVDMSNDGSTTFERHNKSLAIVLKEVRNLKNIHGLK